MRISLISPKWNKMVNSYPPLGLAYIAAVLEREGHRVRVHDFGLNPKAPLEEEIAAVQRFAPDLVGITAMTNTYHSAWETARLIKERIGCSIVIGGPHATVFPDRVVREPCFDYLVYGEGEETMLELVRLLNSEGMRPPSEALTRIKGLCFTHNGHAVCNPARPLIPDLDALPFPARHLFDLERYPLYASNGERMITILSSRGCPFNCSYCFKGIVGRTYRQRSPENIVRELREIIDRYGVRNFYFIDDLFTLNMRRLEALLGRVLEEGLDIRWQCLARVDRVTPEMLRLMHRAGCRQIHYGIESGNEEILRAIGKRITKEQVRRAVKWTMEAGIRAKGYFMLGLPGDTVRTMQQTIDFAVELDLDDAMFSLTTPFPGTRLWDELVSKYPGTEFDHDFSRAYYYTSYTEEVKPFLNVAEVSDETLSRMVLKARRAFAEGKRRRKYVRAFGPTLGKILWHLSRLRPVRILGRAILNSGIMGDLGKFREEENLRQWA